MTKQGELLKPYSASIERRIEMSRFVKIERPAAEMAGDVSTANRNLTIVLIMLAVAIVLIATQWIFVTDNLSTVEAAANAATVGSIEP